MTIKKYMRVMLFSFIFTVASGAGIDIKTPAWRKVEALGKKNSYTFVFCGDAKTEDGKNLRAVLGKIKEELSGGKEVVQKGSVTYRGGNGLKKIDIVDVAIDDSKEQELIKLFNIQSDPTVLVVAPNGAVTGYFTATADKSALVESLVSPKESEVIKNIQDGCVVFLCFHGAQEPDFTAIKTNIKSVADNFKGSVRAVYANSNDKKEEKLRENFKMPSGARTTVFILVPPGRTAAKLEGADITKENLMRTLVSSCGSGGCGSSCK
ncbi:MAG: hypothetical protein ABIH68_08105 [bacterium]